MYTVETDGVMSTKWVVGGICESNETSGVEPEMQSDEAVVVSWIIKCEEVRSVR